MDPSTNQAPGEGGEVEPAPGPGPADQGYLDARIAAGPERFHRLPDRVLPEDMVTEQAVVPARDPEAGRDTDQDFLLRYN